jgi:hypothetical protein
VLFVGQRPGGGSFNRLQPPERIAAQVTVKLLVERQIQRRVDRFVA